MGIEQKTTGTGFKKGTFFAFLIVIIIPLAFYGYFEYKKQTEGVRIKKLPFLSQQSIPHFQLLSQTGDSVKRADLQGKIIVSDFFFCTCPGICLQMTHQMKRLQDFIDGHPNLKSSYLLLSHTVNPEDDSLSVLQDYAAKHYVDPDFWRLLTGPKDEIYDLAINFYKLPAIEDTANGIEPFVHSNKFVLLDKEGFVRGYYDGTDSTSVTELMKDIVYLDIDYEIIEGKAKKKAEQADEH